MTLKEFFKRDRYAVMTGCELLDIREGYARARMTVEEHHLNGADFCQGGALFTLADLAFAAAVNSHLVLTVSTSSNMTFLRSVPLGATVYAEATELVDHHRMPYAEVRITDEQGRLVAIFTSSGYRKQGATLDVEPVHATTDEDTQMHDDSQERFPLVDEQGQVVGAATRGECHNGSRLLHPVVHLHVFNSRGEVFLQKRPQWKDIQPGKWDTSVGGHMDYGESPDDALRREAGEELGLSDFETERVGMYVYDSRRERELVYVNRTVYDGPVNPSATELDGGRFWTLEEIRQAMGKDVLTPNFESEFQRFFL